MKVKNFNLLASKSIFWRQTFRVMRLTICLLLFASMHVYADGFSQTKISLRLENTELKQVLQQIEKKTQIRFLYNQVVLKSAGKVSINAENATVDEALRQVLKGTGIRYKLFANNLIVLNQRGLKCLLISGLLVR